MQFLFFSRSRQNCAFAELWHGFTVDFKRQTQIPAYQKYINRITPELMLHLAGCVFCSRKSKKKPSKLNIYAVCCCVCYGKTIVMLHCSVYFSQNTSVLVSFLWLHLNKPTVIIKMSSWNGWIGGNWWRFEGAPFRWCPSHVQNKCYDFFFTSSASSGPSLIVCCSVGEPLSQQCHVFDLFF